MKRSILCFIFIFTLAACSRPDFVPVEIQGNPTVPIPTSAAEASIPQASINTAGSSETDTGAEIVVQLPTATAPIASVANVTPTPAVYVGIPTPDSPHNGIRDGYAEHVVSSGQTLGTIAQQYESTIKELLVENNLGSADFLQVGQVLRVPLATSLISPATKIIPDSELVYGPTVRDFSIREFVLTYYPQSALLGYSETVEGQTMDGVGSIELAAVRFSVNPRLLLAMVQYRTGWLTAADTGNVDLNYPMGYVRNGYEGLYYQLTRAANEVNRGYYGRLERGLASILLTDDSRVAFDPTINHGTAGVLTWLGTHDNATYDSWLRDSSPAGFSTTYARLFGNPFGFSYEPLITPDVVQPELTLPWDEGVAWYLTAGAHGGWASGSSWAALDFAPDKEARGCYLHEGWAIAAAGGKVAYSELGNVLLDLDGDGDIGTGWVLMYGHLDTFERIQAGSIVAAGQNLGHPSCEGGFSTGTHLHIGRRYNGVWIGANGDRPFVMDGWVSQPAGREYDGYLVKGDVVKEACICADEINEIFR